MTDRRDWLQGIRVEGPCSTSWEAMDGDGPRRFCAHCQKTVFDVAQLSPRALATLLEAQGGHLCARLTRVDGELVMAPEAAAPVAAGGRLARRPSLAVAGLAGALLGAGAASAASLARPPAATTATHDGAPSSTDRAPRPERAQEPTAAIRGRVRSEDGLPIAGIAVVARNALDGQELHASTGRDGGFTLASVPTGLYDVAGGAEGFAVTTVSGIAVQPGEQREVELTASRQDGQVLLGAIAMPLASLRERFHASDLVATVVVGRSRVLATADGARDVATDVHVETRFKGRGRHDEVVYRHFEADDDTGAWAQELSPGRRLLVFLRHDEDATAARSFVGAVAYQPFEAAEGDDGAALIARVAALATVEEHAQRHGEMDPAELVGWMVDTAEEPRMRGLAVGELATASDALGAMAKATGSSRDFAAADVLALVDRFHAEGGTLRDDPPAAVLGASITTAQRERLAAALRDTTGLRPEDRDLAELVRGWDPRAADEWALARLRDDRLAADPDLVWWLHDLAEDHDSPALRALVDRTEQAIEALGSDDEGETDGAGLDARRQRGEERDRLIRDLYRDFAAALAGMS